MIPKKEKGPNQHTEKVIVHESCVEGGLEKVAVFDFVQNGSSENEDETKNNAHIEEALKTGFVE